MIANSLPCESSALCRVRVILRAELSVNRTQEKSIQINRAPFSSAVFSRENALFSSRIRLSSLGFMETLKMEPWMKNLPQTCPQAEESQGLIDL